jgi:Domain of unknown function (DU1801)
MLPADYIKHQPAERQEILTAIHTVISAHDKTVIAVVEPMMGKEMILYKMQQGKGMMKYGLASVKNHMSLHLLPMYMSPKIYEKYMPLLAQAKFQKGCINFNSETDMPLPVVQQLIIDCAPVDLQKMRDDYQQSKKTAKKKIK